MLVIFHIAWDANSIASTKIEILEESEMDELRQLVHDLENERDTNKQVAKLQEIGRKLLT